MINIDIQIHGYRKGHQLLASSVILSKDDQAIVDRLSDVAGPLRPKEQFAPYLSAYPLPSGTYYVIARTWQDLSVPRAGCVRTKSLLLNAQVWSRRPSLVSILRLLESLKLPTEMEATRIKLEEQPEVPLSTTPNFNSGELLEALFLEEPKPIVVFDAPEPELIALHLLTALWPDFRRKFALSTFALSPRKMGGRNFDLVFAPSSAKAKFSDWPGRRVDGRSPQINRHRWTKLLIRRIFEEPLPKLLSDKEINLLGNRDVDSTTSFRIALLWEELFSKLDQTPTATLGLLDIANSGMVDSIQALRLLEPRMLEAIRKAKDGLPHKDAWDFVGAITRKMQGYDLPDGKSAVELLVAYLAEHAPDGALNLLQQPDPEGAIDSLLPSIAMGLGRGAEPQINQALIKAPMDTLAHLVLQGGMLARRVTEDDELIKRIGVILSKIDQELADKAGMVLLPLLVEDRHFPAATQIFRRLNPEEVAAELCWLGDVSNFQSKLLSSELIERAREIGGISEVRDVLILSGTSAQADALLALTIKPDWEDMLWLLDEQRLSKTTATAYLVDVMRRADERQFAELLSNKTIGERLVERLPNDAIDVLSRAALQKSLPMNSLIHIIQSVLTKVEETQQLEIAVQAFRRCLRTRFDGDETLVLSMLLSIIGVRLDVKWAAREGLGRDIDAGVASRNLIVFEKATSPARQRIVGAIDEIAHILHQRFFIDLTEAANDACARLMFDAEKTSRTALIRAAGTLIPSLLRARREPVSLIIAALFPIVYQELAKSDDVPEPLNFFFFFDWDRCKTARKELISAFMSSSWKAGDLALTACRCGDIAKILKQVAKSYGGEEYLTHIESDLGRLDEDGSRIVKHLIAEILSRKSS